MATLELTPPCMAKQSLDEAKVKTRRADLGLTQQECADRASLTVGRWSDIEGGRLRNPTLDTLARVASALECDVADLLTPFAPKKPRRK